MADHHTLWIEGHGSRAGGGQIREYGTSSSLVDTDFSELKLGAPLPATDKILHFGKGQTETMLTLTPGKHTLELVFADYVHMSSSAAALEENHHTVNDMRAILHIDMDAFYASVKSRIARNSKASP